MFCLCKVWQKNFLAMEPKRKTHCNHSQTSNIQKCIFMKNSTINLERKKRRGDGGGVERKGEWRGSKHCDNYQ